MPFPCSNKRELLREFSMHFFSAVDDTRVVLRDSDASVLGSDYINANYIKVIIKAALKSGLMTADDSAAFLCARFAS